MQNCGNVFFSVGQNELILESYFTGSRVLALKGASDTPVKIQ
jgi:hypothetical protein